MAGIRRSKAPGAQLPASAPANTSAPLAHPGNDAGNNVNCNQQTSA